METLRLRGGMRRWLLSRRFGFFLCLLGFVWGVAVINMSLVNYTTKSSEDLREEILDLSERYVKTLAQETRDTIDGPYAGRLTGYDLKKTIAVLLENMMDRIGKLEKKVDDALKNGTFGRNLPPSDAAVGIPPALPQHIPVPVPSLQAGAAKVPAQPQKVEQQQPEPPVDAKDLILGAQEDCSLTDAQKATFPHCLGKIEWMRAHWKSDVCYSQYGVDGSDCSFRVYLSEVETWCPLLVGRNVKHINQTTPEVKKAELNLDMSGLMAKLQDPGQRPNYDWMRLRISRMWPNWVEAAKQLAEKHDMTQRVQKRVLVHLGLLSKKAGFKIAETSFKGGPLGELVQWSDIISSLHILGHTLTITSEVEQLSAVQKNLLAGSGSDGCSPSAVPDVVIFTDLVGWRQIRKRISMKERYSRRILVMQMVNRAEPGKSCPAREKEFADVIFTDYVGLRQIKRSRHNRQVVRIIGKLPTAESQCQNRDALPIDMIFTDIVGLTQFKRKVRSGYGKFSCLLRIIDSFGTEPAFNFDVFAKSHRLKTQWGMQNLDPRQFFTMFPHSPDNSFMGFVVEQHLNASERALAPARSQQGVVYGKAEYMWQGKDRYLDIIKKHVEIHGTVFVEKKDQSIIPAFVKNHGILPGPDLHKLLRESKLFIGLGFPYEGPAPLEAIAQGNIFINPKFDPPHNSENTKFFKGKPTRRKLTSQHPYAEEFIGEPHVLTVDMNNSEHVEEAVKKAIQSIDSGQVKGFMPYEYQEEGMLQRVSAYLNNQDFCNPKPDLWPPEDQVTVILAPQGLSCKDACRQKDLICEPGHFRRINNQAAVEQQIGKSCGAVVKAEDIYFPAYRSDTHQCVLQQQALLFSCVGESHELQRVCPCRTYIKGQTALCKTCL